MIQSGEITSFVYNKSEYRNGRFQDVQRSEEEKHKIYKAIYEKSDFDYYDKFGNLWKINEIKMYRNPVDEIIKFAEVAAKESREEIDNYVLWLEFIKPLFKTAFNLEYRTEYVGMYNREKTHYIETQKGIFFKKNK